MAKWLMWACLVVGVLTAVMWKVGHKIVPSPAIPVLEDGWWARTPKENFKQDSSIRPFNIAVPDEVLKDLKTRLRSSRLTDPLENVGFEYGFNSRYMKDVIDYWLDKYDWRKEEARLNQYQGFKTQIEGIDIHFWHIKPKDVPPNTTVIPLLMAHGWPGSIVEFHKILPLLTTPRPGIDFVFEVICPHIPGYGFSEAPHVAGFGPLDTAQVFAKLMARLGFNQYYVQGGDWGSQITTIMSILYPERITGLHINMAFIKTDGQWIKYIIGHYLPWLVVDSQEYDKVYPMDKRLLYLLKESGYMHLQATKPDTVGLALTDSPAGLAGYILEKFSTWTNPENTEKADGGLTEKFSMDELLTNVMLYWTTKSITSSMRYYKESFADYHLKIDKIPVNVPTAFASFPNELITLPRSIIEHSYFNLVQYTAMPRGGHFPAMEEPQLLADDVWSFVALVEKEALSKTAGQ